MGSGAPRPLRHARTRAIRRHTGCMSALARDAEHCSHRGADLEGTGYRLRGGLMEDRRGLGGQYARGVAREPLRNGQTGFRAGTATACNLAPARPQRGPGRARSDAGSADALPLGTVGRPPRRVRDKTGSALHVPMARLLAKRFCQALQAGRQRFLNEPETEADARRRSRAHAPGVGGGSRCVEAERAQAPGAGGGTHETPNACRSTTGAARSSSTR